MQLDETFEIDVDDTTLEVDLEQGQEQEVVDLNKDDQPADETASFLYEVFKERGIIEDEDFDGTEEWIEQKLGEYPQRVKEGILNSVPSETKDFVELLLTKPNLTREDFVKFYDDFLNDEQPVVDSIDEARDFLESKLKEQGLRANAIKAQLDDLEDEGLLLDEAKKYLESETKTSKNLQNVKQELGEQQTAYNQFMENVVKEVEQFPEARRETIKRTMGNVSAIVNEISQSPSAYVELVNLLSYYKDGKFDLTTFKKQAQTEVTKSLKDKLQGRQVNTSQTKQTQNTTPKPGQVEFVI